MSDFHFVLVSLDVHDRDYDAKSFEKILDRANDWIEFRERTWLLWTKRSSKTWYGLLKPQIGRGDNLFVVAADIDDRGGWMPTAFWEFVRGKTKAT